jgi:hypothetical protein
MRRRLIIALLCIMTTAFSAALHIHAQNATSPTITSPHENDTLFGLVTIQGTANNPNMQRYTLEFDLQDIEGDNFFPVSAPITQPVSAGVLGQWNTTAVPDGRYQIRLSVILRDGTVLSTVVQNLHVSNKQPTPLPTSVPAGSQLVQSPTSGPSATPIIQQPPTSTPLPALAPTVTPNIAPPVNTAAGQDASPIVAVFSALQKAFCTGMLLAIGAFVIFGLYGFLHSRIRPAIQRMMNRR